MTNQDVLGPPMLTEKEVSVKMGVSIITLKKFRKVGGGPRFCKIGTKSVRYRASAVQKYIESVEMDTY